MLSANTLHNAQLLQTARKIIGATGLSDNAYVFGGYMRDNSLKLDARDVDVILEDRDASVTMDALTKLIVDKCSDCIINIGINRPGVVSTFYTTHGEIDMMLFPHRMDNGEFNLHWENAMAYISLVDFTVNGLYAKLFGGEIFDSTPCGIEDIRNRTVRTLYNLRDFFVKRPDFIVKAVRLFLRMNGRVETKTLQAMRDSVDCLIECCSTRDVLRIDKIDYQASCLNRIPERIVQNAVSELKLGENMARWVSSVRECEEKKINRIFSAI